MSSVDLFFTLVDNTVKDFFDIKSGLNYFRVKACIYSYNKI